MVSRLFTLVGQAGFEPTTPSPPVKCATRLRYCPSCPDGAIPAQGWRTILSAAGNGNARYADRALFFKGDERHANPGGNRHLHRAPASSVRPAFPSAP